MRSLLLITKMQTKQGTSEASATPLPSEAPPQTAGSTTSLPNEIWLHIFSFLHPGLKATLCLTCQEWRNICELEVLWRRWYERDYPSVKTLFEEDDYEGEESNDSWQQKYR